ncbi:hypothetical protein ACFLTP_03165 [Chloroflexota bacterium]
MSTKKSAVKNPKSPKSEEPQLQEIAPTELQPETEAPEPQPELETSPEPVTSTPEPETPSTTPVNS